MAERPLRFLVRELVPEFYSKERRDPTFLEGFIFGLILFKFFGGSNFQNDAQSEQSLNNKKLELFLDILSRDFGIEKFGPESKTDQDSILIDVNLKEFNGGLFDRKILDLTKFRSVVKIKYAAYWAVSNEFICKNEINIKKMVGPAWGSLLTRNTAFGLPLANNSPSETGMALLLLKGLERMVQEIKREARPTPIYRLTKWWLR